MKAFGLENWRVFKDQINLDHRKITILTGANSSGKSSFHKGMLALKGAIDKNGKLSTELNKKGIGFFANNITRNSPSNSVKFRITSDTHFEKKFHNANHNEFKFIWPSFEQFSLEYCVKKSEEGMGLHSKGSTIKLFDKNNDVINLRWMYTNFSKYYKPFISLHNKMKQNYPDEYDPNHFFSVYRSLLPESVTNVYWSEKDFSLEEKNILQSDGLFQDVFKGAINWQRIYKDSSEIDFNLPFSYYNLKSYMDLEDPKNREILLNYELDNFGIGGKFLLDENKLLEIDKLIGFEKWPKLEEFRDRSNNVVRFLNLDERPEIRLLNATYNLFINSMGEEAMKMNDIEYIPSIRSFNPNRNAGPTNDYFSQVVNKISQKSYNRTEVKGAPDKQAKDDFYLFIVKWIVEFDIGEDFIIEQTATNNLNLSIKKDGVFHNIDDMGYGHSQVLPIILALGLFLFSNEGSKQHPKGGMRTISYYKSHTVVIDEPETNLHPALQSKLADMFVEVTQKYNTQLIIETHSEYLIRRLQYLIGTKKYEAEDAIIHYFYHPDKVPFNEKQVYPIEFQKSGILSKPFGKGFYDEASNLSLALFSLNYGQDN